MLLHLLALLLISSPSGILSGRSRGSDWPGTLPLRRPLSQCRASRQATPLDHPFVTYSFFLVLALDFATVVYISVAPNLMHGLLLYPAFDTLPVPIMFSIACINSIIGPTSLSVIAML